MTADPRAALSELVAALERHLETAAARRGIEDPSLVQAYERIADAFTAYDDALMEAYGEVTPLEVYDDDSDDDEFDDEFDDDDDDDDEDVSDDEADDDDSEDDGSEHDDDDDDDDDNDDDNGTYVGLDDEEFDVDPNPRG